MRWAPVALLALCSCGSSRLTSAPPELKAVTYNMYYGLASELLPENLSTGALSASAVAIINATTLTDFRCRIQAAAKQIVAEAPDVIGLQEGLLIAFAPDLDDRDDDSVLVDFIDELVDAIEDAGGPTYQVFERENALIEDSLPLFGGIRIADRGAILVSPNFKVGQVDRLTYQALEAAADFVPGTHGVVVRGAIHVQVPYPTGTLDFYNTHLQSGGDAAIREAQAAELNAWIFDRSADGTIVLMGDLNDVPSSRTVTTLTANLVDTYAQVGAPTGFTAYQAPSLNVPVDQADLRIDFILVRAPAVRESRVLFNAMVAPCNLWPSDHFGVVSRIQTVP
jgi:endonuclease/exonuclease/phosphatase family metal-dependent hydrolase